MAITIDATLNLAPFTDIVQVMPVQSSVDATSAGTRHAVSVTRIERMPVAASSRGIEAVLVAFPGFAQNANGAIHPRGAHNQMTFLVDGLAISDQLTGAFANSLDVSRRADRGTDDGQHSRQSSAARCRAWRF